MGTCPDDLKGVLTERSRLACPCCGRLELHPDLELALKSLHRRAGVPLHITSGYRCPKHNRAIGGATHSYHTRGMAADVVIAGQDVLGMYRMACDVPAFFLGGIGLYDGGFIHVDDRHP